MRPFSTTELARRAGISVRQATHWRMIGLLPDHGRGTGVPLRWGYRDVAVAATLGRLASGGALPGREVSDLLYSSRAHGWVVVPPCAPPVICRDSTTLLAELHLHPAATVAAIVAPERDDQMAMTG